MVTGCRYECGGVKAVCVAGRDEDSLTSAATTTSHDQPQAAAAAGSRRKRSAVHFAAVVRGPEDQAGSPDTLALFSAEQAEPLETRPMEGGVQAMVVLDGPPHARGLVCLTRSQGVVCLSPPFRRPGSG